MSAQVPERSHGQAPRPAATAGLGGRRAVLACAMALSFWPALGRADAAGELRNWGDDPFMALRADASDCPEPRGPRMSAQEWRAEAHWRIETGTSCWLAGRCADANAFRYDAPMARALFPALRSLPELRGSSVWAYLQRRILFLPGCVPDPARADAIEAAIRRATARVAPDVQMVVPA